MVVDDGGEVVLSVAMGIYVPGDDVERSVDRLRLMSALISGECYLMSLVRRRVTSSSSCDI